jgi:hypothetical protein
MKNNYLLYAICYFMVVNGCNPSAGKPDINEFVKLGVTVSNTSENIPLGDTLKIRLSLPDTVKTSLRNMPVQSLQRGFFVMSVMKYDTINKRVTSVRVPNIWLTIGNSEGELSYVLKNNSKPYEVIINVNPKEKGMYRFEVVPQPGTLKINDIETKLLVGFNVPDYHYNILNIVTPYFGGQPYYDAFVQRNIEGFGVYFFRVI